MNFYVRCCRRYNVPLKELVHEILIYHLFIENPAPSNVFFVITIHILSRVGLGNSFGCVSLRSNHFWYDIKPVGSFANGPLLISDLYVLHIASYKTPTCRLVTKLRDLSLLVNSILMLLYSKIKILRHYMTIMLE